MDLRDIWFWGSSCGRYQLSSFAIGLYFDSVKSQILFCTFASSTQAVASSCSALPRDCDFATLLGIRIGTVKRIICEINKFLRSDDRHYE